MRFIEKKILKNMKKNKANRLSVLVDLIVHLNLNVSLINLNILKTKKGKKHCRFCDVHGDYFQWLGSHYNGCKEVPVYIGHLQEEKKVWSRAKIYFIFHIHKVKRCFYYTDTLLSNTVHSIISRFHCKVDTCLQIAVIS